MIKAILFDCFGVLVGSSYEPFKKKYFGDNAELIKRFIEIEDRSSRGEIALTLAEQGFAELARIPFEQVADELANNPRNAELLDFIENELKSKFKIGLLSNVAKDRTKELFTDADIALFDDIVLSFQVGLAKPDPQIFMMAAERLGVEPDECVFVDDLSKYLLGAESIGMSTVLYTSMEGLRVELTKIGVLND